MSIALKRDNVFLRGTYTAGLDDPVYSHLANAFRVRGSTNCKCLLQIFSKFLALVNCVRAFATMIYHPPTANPTFRYDKRVVYGKKLFSKCISQNGSDNELIKHCSD